MSAWFFKYFGYFIYLWIYCSARPRVLVGKYVSNLMFSTYGYFSKKAKFNMYISEKDFRNLIRSINYSRLGILSYLYGMCKLVFFFRKLAITEAELEVIWVLWRSKRFFYVTPSEMVRSCESMKLFTI